MAEYIERSKALAIRFTDGINEDGVLYVPWRDVDAHLKSLPCADVRENVHGKWVHIHSDNVWECSNCCMRREYILTKFCPNCGADMRGGTNA